MNRRNALKMILPLVPLVLGTTSTLAASHNSSGSSSVLPCVMADFVGGAPYPEGMGPFTEITYPNTGESVTDRVYVQ